jgi:hypothetical protein
VSDAIHTFPDGIRINRSIPQTMTEAGLHYLGRLARSVPQNGVIVEVGPLYGSSTWVLSHNADPSVKIYSIDTWEPAPWIEKRLPDALPFGLDAFKHYIADCPNVTPIQGFSPDVVPDWNERIDLFFDDATHGDPGFSNNVNFFLPFVTDQGILCGDDYASGWPDIVRVVNALADSWGVEPEVSGRVWAIMKNGAANPVARRVAERLGPWTEADLTLSVALEEGDDRHGQPRMWTGRSHETVALTGIGVHCAGAPLAGSFDVRLADGRELADLPFGEVHRFGAAVTDFRARLSEEDAARFALGYQGCQFTRTPRKTMNTSASPANAWLNKEAGSELCALLLTIDPRKPA